MTISSIGSALCAVALLCGCQLLQRSGGDGPDRIDLTEKRVLLGEVTLVNENSQFVLIKTPVKRRLDPGIPLESFRDGQMTGELLFSPEQSTGFMTADITNGTPGIGDVVYLRHIEDFEEKHSDRFKYQAEQLEREKNMSFFERRKHARKIRQAKQQRERGR